MSGPEQEVADARALAERGAIAEALAAYDAVVARHGADPAADVADAVATALAEKAELLADDERAEEALAAFGAVLDHDAGRGPEEADAWRADDRRLRVLRAHARGGALLASLGRFPEALTAYDAALALDDGSGDEDVLARVRVAWCGRVSCFSALERWREAVAAADAGLARLAASDEGDFRVASLMYDKAWALRALGHRDEQLDVLYELEARFGTASAAAGVDPDLRRHVLDALLQRAETLVDLARDEEVVAVCDTIVVRFGDAADTGARGAVVRACAARARALEVLGRVDEAIAAHRDTLVRFGADEDPGVRSWVVATMGDLAERLVERGDADEALVMLDAYVNAGGDADWALMTKGTQLHRLGRHDEAVAAYDEVLAANDGDEPYDRTRRLSTLMHRVEALAAAGHDDAAAQTRERITDLAGDDAARLFGLLAAELGERDDPRARTERAGLALTEAMVHRARGREVEARALLEALVARAGDDELPAVRRLVALARDELGEP